MAPHTLYHTEVLNCADDDAWQCFKDSDRLLPDLLPEYFSKSEIVKGYGGPGTVRVWHFGPAIPEAGAAMQVRVDHVDEAKKTLSYTVVNIEGVDSRYKSCTGEVRFVSTGDGNQTEATWTAKFDPIGDAAPLEHMKEIITLIGKTFEKAVQLKQTVLHTETLDAAPDAIWTALKNETTLLPEVLPEIFDSITVVEGTLFELGSVRVCKMGPAIPHDGDCEVVERLDVFDDVQKKVGYTFLKGLPFKYLSVVVQFTPGPAEGTTTATWKGTFVPVDEHDVLQPTVILHVWKAFESAAKQASLLSRKGSKVLSHKGCGDTQLLSASEMGPYTVPLSQ